MLLSWLLRLAAAIILGQTLFFKFTGAEESRFIFSTLGMEPWGRYATGVGELIAVVLLLIPATAWLGAGLGLGLMSGAIFFHLVRLGIEIRGDGGLLFYLAVAVWLSCAAVLVLHRHDLKAQLARLPF